MTLGGLSPPRIGARGLDTLFSIKIKCLKWLPWRTSNMKNQVDNQPIHKRIRKM